MKVARVTVSAMAQRLCLGCQFPSMPGDIGTCSLEDAGWDEDAGKSEPWQGEMHAIRLGADDRLQIPA
jgi:hypothetical protein